MTNEKKIRKKTALYLRVNVLARTKVLVWDTIFHTPFLEMGPPFYVVIRAM